MKIRTDFVTNSSSSSFVVEISLQSVDGKEYSVMIDPEDYVFYEGGSQSADLKCSATAIAKIDSVEALVDLLTQSVDIGDPDEEYDEEKVAKVMSRFGDEVRQGISDVSQIASIKFKRTWVAGGEGSSCFGWNLHRMAEELPGLAKRVCESKGEEKEVAKKEMAEYLAKFNGRIYGAWGDCFPSGFMGSTVTGAIVWDKFVDSIEKLAKKVLAQKLPDEDWAEETTEIDMQTREISQKAEYILDGLNAWSRERRRVRRKT